MYLEMELIECVKLVSSIYPDQRLVWICLWNKVCKDFDVNLSAFLFKAKQHQCRGSE